MLCCLFWMLGKRSAAWSQCLRPHTVFDHLWMWCFSLDQTIPLFKSIIITSAKPYLLKKKKKKDLQYFFKGSILLSVIAEHMLIITMSCLCTWLFYSFNVCANYKINPPYTTHPCPYTKLRSFVCLVFYSLPQFALLLRQWFHIWYVWLICGYSSAC